MQIIFNKPTGEIIDGKEITGEKIYIAPAPKARMVRRAVEIVEKTNFNNLTTEALDEMVGYLVDLFGKQFTIDDIYDGLDADKLIPTLIDCISKVNGGLSAKLEQFPKNEQTGA